MLHIKRRFFFPALLLIVAGCTTTVVQDSNYYFDAVHRVVTPETFANSPFAKMANGLIFLKSANELGFYRIGVPIDTLEQGQKFDAAVGLFRVQGTNGLADPSTTSIGRMSFQLNNAPAQVGAAAIDNNTLPWISAGSWMYVKADPNLYGSQDSMTFSYSDFNGETNKETVSTAPAFGIITFPDTISLSHGCTISYQHPVANDSIEIYVDVFDSSFLITRPDTGSIVFAPNELPPDRMYSNAGFMISLYRWNWSTRTSPSGKKIAVYSSMETQPVFIPYKP